MTKTKEQMISDITDAISNILSIDGITSGDITISFSREEVTTIKARFEQYVIPSKEVSE